MLDNVLFLRENKGAKASWPKECDGKTEEEIHELGYEVIYLWLVEEED